MIVVQGGKIVRVIDQVPTFFNPEHAASWAYRPDVQAVRAEAAAWQSRHRLAPATEAGVHAELLVIDCQKDFCLPEGALFVAGRSGRGAIDDSRRIAEFIYRNLANLTRVTLTLDSHLPLQIFFDSFWQDRSGNRPPPFTQITGPDLRSGSWRLDPAAAQFAPAELPDGLTPYDWAVRQAQHYVDHLDRSGKYGLTIWPYHCLVGSDGHAVVGLIQEARLFHGAARAIQSEVELKGSHPWTEHYSVFGPEVRTRWSGEALAVSNQTLMARLLRSDAVIFAGQAASHCFLWSIDDLLNNVRRAAPDLVRKLYVLRDCSSPVVVFGADGRPVVDYTDATEAAFARWQSEGLNIVTADTDMAAWPGLGGIGA